MKHIEKQSYQKPAMTKLDNVKDITMNCPEFACSIDVPPPPS